MSTIDPRHGPDPSARTSPPRIPRPSPATLLLAMTLAAVMPAHSGPGSITGSTWQPIGPDPVLGFFGGGVTGRATALAVNPSNGYQVWLGTASGGVWYSANGGGTWYPLMHGEPALAIGAIAVRGCDPNGCSKILAGTGENNIRRDTYYGRGLLVGTRNGKPEHPPAYDWVLKDGLPMVDFALGSIHDIQINPLVLGGGPIYVSFSSGVTSSASQSTRTAPEPIVGGYGLYKSSDGGAAWIKLDVPGSGDARPTDLDMDPNDDDVLYAGFMGTGAFKSTDGGVNWCPLTAGITVPEGCTAPTEPLPGIGSLLFDFVEIAIAPSNSDVVYVTLGHCPEELLQRCKPTVYRSGNGGVTWDPKLTGNEEQGDPLLDPHGYSRYTHLLAVHPENPNELWLGALRLWKSSSGGAGFGGSDLNSSIGVSRWGAMLHFDHHELAFDASDSDHMYDTNDGGVAATITGGNVWEPRNNGLQILGFQSITVSPLADRLIGGSQDNGGVRWTGTATWDYMPCCGDAGFSVIDAVDPDRFYVLGNQGKVSCSNDGGNNWWNAMSGLPIEIAEPRNMYAPFVQDPTWPHAVYWGAQALYRGQPGSKCEDLPWKRISPFLETDPHPGVVGGEDAMSAIAVAPSNPDRVFIGYYGGGIYHSNPLCDECVTVIPELDCPNCDWPEIGATLPDLPITRIAVDPVDPDTLFVTLAGFDPAVSNVWKTDQLGVVWQPANNGLPAGVPVNTIHYDPGDPGVLFLGMDGNPTGDTVFSSTDGGVSWDAFTDGLPNVPIYDIAVDPSRGTAFAATHGRGAYAVGGPWMTSGWYWQSNTMQEVTISGALLPPSLSCTMSVVLEDDTVCATGSVDAMGGALRTDAQGRLVSDREGMYDALPLAWPCFGPQCVGGTDADACRLSDNPLARIDVNCGAAVSESVTARGPTVRSDPAGAALNVNPQGDTGAGGSRSFDLTPVLFSADGTSRSLCTVHVAVDADDDPDSVLAEAHSALSASPVCVAAGVVPRLVSGFEFTDEDEFPRNDILTLSGPGLVGTQIVPAVHSAPGHGNDLCFSLFDLGLPMRGQLQAMELQVLVGEAGAQGGELTLIERSPLGTCAVTVATEPGQAGDDVAASLEAAFQAPGIPGPNPGCPARANPRDVVADGYRLDIVAASEVQICTTDPGLGFRIQAPDAGPFHPAAAIADEGLTAECTSAGGTTVGLDGTASSDPDSTPGTNDDIVLLEWYEDFGLASQLLLGTEDQIQPEFTIGGHAVTLRVVDLLGLEGLMTVQVNVVDTVPPSVGGNASPAQLFPPNHEMHTVTASMSVTDLCGATTLVLDAVSSDEPDDAPGDADGATVADIQGALPGSADFDVDLRAERNAAGTGRTYSLNYMATDASGNQASTSALVQVPVDVGGVVEPLLLEVSKNAAGTVVSWGTVAGAASYNVVRGSRTNITDAGTVFDLGSVIRIESASLDTDTAGDEDAENPAPGEVFFYLVEYDDGTWSGFSTESAAKPRVVQLPEPKQRWNSTGR